MLELSSPDLLFNKQKVFHLIDSVTKTTIEKSLRKAVIVFDVTPEIIAPAMTEMLDKLIQACRFKPEETIYLNARFASDVSLITLQNTYQPDVVLIFGDVVISRNLTKLRKNFPYELNGVKIVNAESMELLLKNDAAKKALWGVLKKMLNL